MSTTSAVSNTSSSLDLLNLQNQAKGKQTLGADDFMKLLTVQLSSQDPLKPMEDTAFIAQMASFSSLEQMRTLTDSFDTFAKDQKLTEANSYLGKTVTVTDANGADVSGQVTQVSVTNGAPQILVNGTAYDVSAITAVATTATTTTDAATTPASNATTAQLSSAPTTPTTDTTKGTN